MREERIRVAVRLAPEWDADTFLAAAEEALGHPVPVAQRLRTAPVLSLWLRRGELETIQTLPGVEQASPERKNQIPPRPPLPKQERE